MLYVLFPEPGTTKLIGIARAAAESNVLEAKRRVQYFDLPTRQFIGRATGRKMPFDWTINPYRGCEFGCKYCYARYTHEFMELREPEQFEQLIYAKQFRVAAFRQELIKIPGTAPIAIGTATDPYQPAERRYQITQKILLLLAEEAGRDLGLVTKSDLITRDVYLLSKIAKRNSLHIFMTITTVDEHLARLLEPFAPRPVLRLAAIRALSAAGVRVGITACPVMPLINDSDKSLSAIAEEGARAGATYLVANPLFLKPCAQKAFYPFLEERFPHLVRRYRERYQKSAFLSGEYPEIIRKRVSEIRIKYGLTQRPSRYEPDEWPGDPQLDLF